MRFGRAIIDSIQYLKTHQPESLAIMRQYSKLENTDAAVADVPYPTIEGLKRLLIEIGRSRPEALTADPASFADFSIVKALEEERKKR